MDRTHPLSCMENTSRHARAHPPSERISDPLVWAGAREQLAANPDAHRKLLPQPSRPPPSSPAAPPLLVLVLVLVLDTPPLQFQPHLPQWRVRKARRRSIRTLRPRDAPSPVAPHLTS